MTDDPKNWHQKCSDFKGNLLLFLVEQQLPPLKSLQVVSHRPSLLILSRQRWSDERLHLQRS